MRAAMGTNGKPAGGQQGIVPPRPVAASTGNIRMHPDAGALSALGTSVSGRRVRAHGSPWSSGEFQARWPSPYLQAVIAAA